MTGQEEKKKGKVGEFFEDVKENVQEGVETIKAKRAARKAAQEASENPAPAPVLEEPAPSVEETLKTQFAESAKNLKPLKSTQETDLERVNQQLKGDNREFVDGGYAVNGYFVADDSLSQNEATTAAKKYYAAKHGDYADNLAPTTKHDPFQWQGKQYTTQTGTIASTARYDKLPAIVKASDYAKYDELKAEKTRLESELPEKPAMAAAATPAPASAQVAKPEEKAAEKTEEKSEVKAEDQAQVAAKAVETPEGSQEKPTANTPVASAPATATPATNAPASNAPATATPATASPAASTARPAQTAPAGATPVANAAAPAATSAPASSTPATTQTASTGTEEEDTYTKNEKFLKEQAEKQKEEVRKIYDNEIGGYDKLYEEAMKRKEALAGLDKERSKKENAYRYITGVGDLVSGFANLVGTAHNASHQDQTYVAPELVKKAEAARKERKLEMDALNKRLDEMRARKDALTTQRDTKLSEIDAKMVSDISKANLQKASDERALNIQGMKGELEKAKQAGRIQLAEIKAAASLNNTRLRIQTTQGGRVKNATFYDANGKPQVLNVYFIDDVGEEVIKAVNANKASWSESEKEEYNNAVNKATLSSTYGGDGGEALELFYTKMAQKPYVYQHFKRLVGGTTSTTTTTSTTRTSGGSSVDSALEGL